MHNGYYQSLEPAAQLFFDLNPTLAGQFSLSGTAVISYTCPVSGIVINAPTEVTRPLLSGGLLDFNGSQRLINTNKALWEFLHDGRAFTVLYRFKTNAADPQNFQGIIGNNGTSGTRSGFSIAYDDRTTFGGDYLYAGVASVNDSEWPYLTQRSSPYSPATNAFATGRTPGAVWNSCVFSHRRNGSFVGANGQVSVRAFRQGAIYTAGGSTNNFTIGAVGGAESLGLNGQLARLVIYRGAMPEHQAIEEMNKL